MTEPVAVAVAAGLFFGKAIGIFWGVLAHGESRMGSPPRGRHVASARWGSPTGWNRVHHGPLHRLFGTLRRPLGCCQGRHHHGLVRERGRWFVHPVASGEVNSRHQGMRILLMLAVLFLVDSVAAQKAPVFYSYVGNSGRTVYVNRFSMIPPEKRSKARAVDLSQVSLNSELAEELSAAVVKEIQLLKKSDPCDKARAERKIAAWRHIWNRHGPWILSSLAAAILLLISPWMIQRTPQGVWARFLMVAFSRTCVDGSAGDFIESRERDTRGRRRAWEALRRERAGSEPPNATHAPK